ncbi:MAG: hypothetical protein HC857_17925 [Synechococcales cyanobacterium RU_4_20]|nr:hypothetical protein [Synechococcales cyanobacterium RU_4_20]NJR69048.1 hypothetical protein [Synechococcales cyanobacterium CRU_2_2]
MNDGDERNAELMEMACYLMDQVDGLSVVTGRHIVDSRNAGRDPTALGVERLYKRYRTMLERNALSPEHA